MHLSLLELRHRLVLQTCTRLSDEMGGLHEQWQDSSKTFWGKVRVCGRRSSGSREWYQAAHGGDLSVYCAYHVFFRYNPHIKPGLRLRWDDTILIVTTPLEHDRFKRWSEFYTTQYLQA